MTVRFKRQAGGVEDVECDLFVLTSGWLECLRRNKNDQSYLFYGVPACDVQWVEEIMTEDPNPT